MSYFGQLKRKKTTNNKIDRVSTGLYLYPTDRKCLLYLPFMVHKIPSFTVTSENDVSSRTTVTPSDVTVVV